MSRSQDPGATRDGILEKGGSKSLDNGIPIPIGLARSQDPFNCHVVVATGYQEGTGDFTIYCYDCNDPDGESVLYLDRTWKHWRFMSSGSFGPGETFRGYFVQDAYAVNVGDGYASRPFAFDDSFDPRRPSRGS